MLSGSESGDSRSLQWASIPVRKTAAVRNRGSSSSPRWNTRISGSGDSDDASETSTLESASTETDATVPEVTDKQEVAIAVNGGTGVLPAEAKEERSFLPKFDDLDKRLLRLLVPCIANFAIGPLVGAVDLFWVNQMRNPLAVAGQAAANQIFFFGYLFMTFLPGVTTPLVAKANASEDLEGVQDASSQALALGGLLSLGFTTLMLTRSEKVLSILMKAGAPAMEYAKPYLLIRGTAFLPAITTLIGFATFRGVMDPKTPFLVSLGTNIINAILDPILMFGFKMGVSGAALATVAAEVLSAGIFLTIMRRRGLFKFSKIFRLPSWAKLGPLIMGGAALQIRSFSLNLTFMSALRAAQVMDPSGVYAAAQAFTSQVFQVGGIFFAAMSIVAQIVIPGELVKKKDPKTGEITGGPRAAKVVASRLLRWGLLSGTVLGATQLALLPVLERSTPLLEVRRAARIPTLLCSFLQVINGAVFVGEGIMVGCSNLVQLSLNCVLSGVATTSLLPLFTKKFGLPGIWLSYYVFSGMRFVGVGIHQLRTGRLAPREIQKAEEEEKEEEEENEEQK